jgi:hypothetical protein
MQVGIGVVAPAYYFLSYVFTPVEKFKSTERRLGRLNYSVTVLPVLLGTYYLPAFCMLQWPTLAGRDKWLSVWQMYPVWASLGSYMFSRFIKDTTSIDKYKPARDIPTLNYSIGAVSSISAFAWIWTFWKSASVTDFSKLFIPVTKPAASSNLVTFTREFLKFDQISLFGSTYLWLGYSFWDMKSAGMIKTSWVRLLSGLLASTVLLGPGATTGIGWLWREQILATKRHKHAITEEYLARKERLKGEESRTKLV